jgi:hypothetical protein
MKRLNERLVERQNIIDNGCESVVNSCNGPSAYVKTQGRLSAISHPPRIALKGPFILDRARYFAYLENNHGMKGDAAEFDEQQRISRVHICATRSACYVVIQTASWSAFPFGPRPVAIAPSRGK